MPNSATYQKTHTPELYMTPQSFIDTPHVYTPATIETRPITIRTISEYNVVVYLLSSPLK